MRAIRSLLLATLAVVGVLFAGAGTALAEVTATTYALPAGVTAGGDLTSDAAGNVWFATGDANNLSTPRVGRFVPSQAAPGTASGITLWPTPTYPGASCCATQVRSLDFDDDLGRLWFVRSDGLYGFGDAAALAGGAPSPFQAAVHPSKIALWGVAYDPKIKRTWIAEYGAGPETPPGSGNRAGSRIASTDTGLALTELPNLANQAPGGVFTSSRFDAKPRGVTPDGNGQAWFAESDPGNPGYRIGHTKPGGYDEYLIEPCLGVSPCSGTFTGTGPTEVAVAKDGTVWFTNHVNNSVGRLDPVGGTFTHFALASLDPSLAAGRPVDLRAAEDGSLWVAQFGGAYVNQAANALVKIVPGPTPTATVFKTGNDGPLAVEPTVGGDVYGLLTTASAPGKLIRLSGAGPVAGGGDPPAPPGTPATPATPASPSVPVPLRPTAAGVAKISPPTADAVKVTQICVGPPQDRCSLVYLLDSREYVTGFPGTKEALAFGAAPKTKKPKKPGTVELGRAEVTIPGGQTAEVQVRLSKKARGLLAKRKKLRVTLRVMEKQADGTLKKLSSKELTFRAKRPKSKR